MTSLKMIKYMFWFIFLHNFNPQVTFVLFQSFEEFIIIVNLEENNKNIENDFVSDIKPV